jgi:hypothetical protein
VVVLSWGEVIAGGTEEALTGREEALEAGLADGWVWVDMVKGGGAR